MDEKGKRKFIENNMVLNVTGGYKGFIPVMTIVALLYQMCEVYIHEEAKENLLDMPKLPLAFDPVLSQHLYWELYFIKEGNNEKRHENTQKELENYQFIFKTCKQIKISALGKLFMDFIHQRQDDSARLFGHLAEYKFYEYAVGQYPNAEVIHGEGNDPEIDLKIKQNNQKTMVEIKNFIDFIDHEKRKKIIDQISDKQFPAMKKEKFYRHELWLYVISIKEKKDELLSLLTEEIMKSYQNQNIFKDSGKECEIKVFLFDFSYNKKDHRKNENRYLNFAKHKIKKSDMIYPN